MQDLINTVAHYKAKEAEAADLLAGYRRTLRTLLKELQQVCPHPGELQDQHSSYFNGSYYDKSYTDYWLVCKVCGLRHSERTSDSGYYG